MPISTAARAQSIWRIILRDPRSIEVTRNGVEMGAQTVRIENDNTNRDSRADVGRIAVQRLTVYGVTGHPSVDVPDTDIEQGDRFWLDNNEYEVRQVNRPPGQVQALADRRE